jgi:hypothetical protein
MSDTVQRNKFPTIPQMLEMTGDGLRAMGGDWYDDIKEMREQIKAIPTPPPCPSWCTKHPGHVYDNFPSSDGEGGAVCIAGTQRKPSPARRPT